MENGLYDPTGRAKIAIGVVLAWFASDFLCTLNTLYTIWSLEGFGPIDIVPDYDLIDRVDLILSGVNIAIQMLSAVFVSRWIIRVNGNSQRWSDGVTITPGWNVIWFFVPVYSLFKPFEGIRQTWQASLCPDDLDSVRVPTLMRLWWASYLAMNLMGYVSLRMMVRAETTADFITACWINVALFLFDFGATILLIMLIRRLTAIQRDAILTRKFAVVDE